MGSLLAFAGEREKTFRFVAEKVGNTLFLIRKENNPNEIIPNVRGYGHTFPEAYTSWDRGCTGSQSHQRLVSYSFGGLKCVIRSETDGYLPQKLEDDHPLKRPGRSRSSGDDKDIVSAFTQTIPFPEESPSSSTDSKTLTVCRAGRVLPQHSIFDVKTRASHNRIDMDELHPRLWVNQTPNLVIAYHNRGVFNDIQIKNVQASVERWEDSSHDTLERLGEALKMLDVLAKKQANKKIEVRRVAKGNLTIWSDVSGNDVLPSDLKAKWLGQ